MTKNQFVKKFKIKEEVKKLIIDCKQNIEMYIYLIQF